MVEQIECDLVALVRVMAEALVDHPELISVSSISTGDQMTLRLQVAPDDLGKVIGKQGRTARSLRTILHGAATIRRRSVALDIAERFELVS